MPHNETSNLSLNDYRILVADDEPFNQRLLGFILNKTGADVCFVDNGQAACDEAASAEARGNAFDLILMDMQMPVLDGYEATQRLREMEYQGPIIALTAHADAQYRDRCFAVGCNDFVTKPADRAKLIELVAKHADAASAQSASTPQS